MAGGSTVYAADLDARTTRTYTAVTDPDIQSAPAQGVTTPFVRTYPIKQDGIHPLSCSGVPLTACTVTVKTSLDKAQAEAGPSHMILS